MAEQTPPHTPNNSAKLSEMVLRQLLKGQTEVREMEKRREALKTDEPTSVRCHRLTYLPFKVGRLVWSGPGQHPGVAEAGPQQSPQHKHEEHASDHWDDWGQLRRQEGTTGGTKKDKKEKTTS